MTGRWWRAYDEAVDDPKVQLLEPSLFKSWFNLMCLASLNGGVLPAIEHIAFKLHVPKLKAELIISALVAANLLEKREDGVIGPHNWSGRQYKSDVIDPTNAERQRRYRKRHAVTANTVTAKRPETETETETETDLDLDIPQFLRRDADWPKDYRELFWQAYPRKVGKGAAIRKLEAICKNGEIEFSRLLAAVSSITASEEKFIPHPLTWLNQGRYLDGGATSQPSTFTPSSDLPTEAELRAKYADRRTAAQTATETAEILEGRFPVRPPKRNGMDVD